MLRRKTETSAGNGGAACMCAPTEGGEGESHGEGDAGQCLKEVRKGGMCWGKEDAG